MKVDMLIKMLVYNQRKIKVLDSLLVVTSLFVTYFFMGMIISAMYCKSGLGCRDRKSEKVKVMRLIILIWPAYIVFIILNAIGDLFYSVALLVFDLANKTRVKK